MVGVLSLTCAAVAWADAEGDCRSSRSLEVRLQACTTVIEDMSSTATQLAVALTLPSSDDKGKKTKKGTVLRIKAVVVRREKDPSSDKYLLALFFSQITDESRKTLTRFIKSRLLRFH